MPDTFEMFVLGIPRSPDSQSCGRWQASVRSAAWEFWPYLEPPIEEEVSAVVIYFFRGATLIDVDNMAKPILDALKRLAYRDDRQISSLLARKTRIDDELEIADASPIVEKALTASREIKSDVVYVRIGPPPDHRQIP